MAEDRVEGRTGRLIVHIGDRKTGSTSIQNALATGAVRLPGRTLCYPSRMAHNYLSREITRAKTLEQTSLPDLMARIGKDSADVTILSAEHFEDMPPEKLREVHDRFLAPIADEVIYVGYLRPHAARTTSSFAEQVKIGSFQGDLEQFFRKSRTRRRFFYAPRTRAWRAAFGEAYRLRPMIRNELKGGNVIEDFLDVALDGAPCTVADSDSANESLGLRDLMVLKLVHGFTQGQGPMKRLELGWAVARFLNEETGAPQDKLRLHRALAEEIASAYRKDARTVDAEMFGGRPLLQTELDKAIEAAPAEAQSFAPEDHFSPEERRTIAALAKSLNMLLGADGKIAGYMFRQRTRSLHSP